MSTPKGDGNRERRCGGGRRRVFCTEGVEVPEKGNVGWGRKGWWIRRTLGSVLMGWGCLMSSCQTGKERGSGGDRFVAADRGLDEVRIRVLEGIIMQDREVLQTLLTPDFVWREDEAPMEETPFEFWDRHKLWGELQRLVRGRTTKRDRLYVAPKEAGGSGYRGPHVVWRKVGAEWRLASFFPGSEPAEVALEKP